jgi:hypothetical protein
MTSTRSRRRVLVLALLAFVVATAAYAFTAGNTVPASKAGDGSGAITGYNVTNVAYNLDAANPQLIDSVEFDLDAAAGEVKAKVQAAGTNWANCTNAVNHWTCDFAVNPTVLSADQLTVVSVS